MFIEKEHITHSCIHRPTFRCSRISTCRTLNPTLEFCHNRIVVITIKHH
jgi:hypothetical protein